MTSPGATDPDATTAPAPDATSTAAENDAARAPLGTLLGRAREDVTGEAAGEAARFVGKNGYLLADAITLGRASLARREDPELRAEVATWCVAIGAFHEGAAYLTPLARLATSPEVAADIWLELASLHARAADGPAAIEAAREAARSSPDDPRPWSFLGALSSWCPTVDADEAAVAWSRAAQLLRSGGDKDAAMEARIRAFAVRPASEIATRELVTALRSRGRETTIDRVLATHARTRPPLEALAIHAERARVAVDTNDPATAFAAFLEAGRDAVIPNAPAVFREALATVGFADLTDAVLTARALATPADAAADAWADLARARRDRGAPAALVLDALAEALDANPEREDLIVMARRAGESDPDPTGKGLRDVLVRTLRAAERRARPADAATRTLLETSASAPQLALVRLYAIEQAQAHGLLTPAGAAEAKSAIHAASESLRSAIAAIAAERRDADDDDARADAARRAIPLLAQSPRDESRCLSYLRDLVGLSADAVDYVVPFVRLARRLGDRGALSWIVSRRSAFPGTSGMAARLAILDASRALGDPDAERAALSAVLSEEAGDAAVATSALASALVLGVPPLLVTALRDLTTMLAGPLRAVALAAAARTALDSGDAREARVLAARAHEADRNSAVALEALGAAIVADPQPGDTEALERVASALVGDAKVLGALAEALEEKGELGPSFLWTQRLHQLRPGDPVVVELLLRRAVAAVSGEHLANVLASVTRLPLPAARLAEPAARTLDASLDDPTTRLARHVLDHIGPSFETVRKAVRAAAIRVDDRDLILAVDNRTASATRAATDLIAFAERLARRGDGAQAMAALVRASEADGSRSFEIAEVVAIPIPRPAKPADAADAELFRLEITALLAERRGEGDAAIRHLDLATRRAALANDPLGSALSALRAITLERKTLGLATNLALTWGTPTSIARLAAVAATLEPEQSRAAGRLLAAVAQRCPSAQDASLVARAALAIDPARSDALASLSRDGIDPHEIDEMHATAAVAAKGVVGRRLAHTRAARLLERRGELAAAFEHARIAFEESPEAPGTLSRAARLAGPAGGQRELVATMERVAKDARSDTARAHWLLRASGHLSEDDEGIRLRTELALRALRAAPELETARAVIDAATAEAKRSDDLEVLGVRFERAIRAALTKRDGPDGARMAVLFARAAMDVFSAPRVAVAALIRALALDASIDEFATLYGHANVLARGEGTTEAESFAASCLAEVSRPFANFGESALLLAARVALAIGDVKLAARLLPFAIKSAMDEEALRPDVLAVLQRLEDPELRAWEEATRPPSAGPEPDPLATPDATPASAADESIASATDAAGRASEPPAVTPTATPAETRAEQEQPAAERSAASVDKQADEPTAPPIERLPSPLEEAALAQERGDEQHALTILMLARETSRSPALVRAIATLVTRMGDRPRMETALTDLVDVATDPLEQQGALGALASLAEEEGDLTRAKRHWQRLVTLRSDSPEALAGLERTALAENDPFALASVLTLRLEAAASKDEARVIRLRRAALLEQRLSDVEGARRELEALIADHEDASALRYLADLHERTGNPAAAAPLWERALDATAEPREAHETAVRAAKAHFAAENLERAREMLTQAGAHGTSERALELRVEIERVGDSPAALGDALDELAISSMDASEVRASLLIEAARAALEAESEPLALSRAQRAVRIAPFLPEAQLLARLLEYRARGPGNRQEAGQTVEDLRRLASNLGEEQIPLHAFLLAEALDVVYGGSAGMRELTVRHAELGAEPLLALGIAERAARAGNFATALPMYRAALRGDLFGLRHRGQVALDGARAALAENDNELANLFLDEARRDPTVADELAGLLEEMANDRPSSPHGALVERVATTTGPDRALALLELARARGTDPASAPDAARLLADAERAAAGDGDVVADITAAREQILGPLTSSVSDIPPSAPAQDDTPFVDLDQDPPASILLSARRRTLDAPGDPFAIGALRAAAEADGDLALERSLAFIEASFSGSGTTLEPPSLAAQREQPEALRALLCRGTDPRIAETMALVWEGAPHLFRREASTYGVTGLDRVSFGSATAVSRVYTLGARLLGATRAPLFQRRSSGPTTATVALLQPAAVVLAGDVREESAELRFRLGVALFGAAPERALLFALPEPSLRALFGAIRTAFGPPDAAAVLPPAVTTLAASLWQTLPARAQRRLRELVEEEIDVVTAVEEANLVARRAGLFLAGDLRIAIAEVLEEERLDLPYALTLEGLAGACEASAAVRDLVTLATSAEFADARWQDGRPMIRAPRGGGGRLRTPE
jgi:cellulose synthase operon protein C